MVFDQRIDLSCLCKINNSFQALGNVMIKTITNLGIFTYILFWKLSVEAKIILTTSAVNDSGCCCKTPGGRKIIFCGDNKNRLFHALLFTNAVLKVSLLLPYHIARIS